MGKWMAFAAGLVAFGGIAVAAWAYPLGDSDQVAAGGSDGGDVIVQAGSTVTVEDADGDEVRVTFVEVLEDSRCPKNVMCIQAGRAVVKLSIDGGSLARAQEVRLALESAPDGESVQVAGIEVQLKDVQPYPEAPNTTQPDEYRATLRIARIGG